MAVAEQYPYIKLEYEAFPTGAAPYTDELMRRIAHDREADIFMTADTSLCGSEELLDLTNEELAGRYSVSILREISGDGSVWMLPGIGAVTCYAYNTEQFPTPPQTLTELVDETSALSLSGANSFIVPYEQTPQLMIQALAAGYLASPNGQLWLEKYNEGKETMSGNEHMKSAWEMAQRMIDNGVLRQEEMVFAESRRTTQLVDGIGAMTTVSSAILEGIFDENDDKFNLIPFVGETEKDKTVFCAPTYYLAASSHLTEKENEKKLDAAKKVLDLISTEKGQNILRGTTLLANSYLNDVAFDLDARYSQVSQALNAGAYGPAPVFRRGVDATIGETFGKMLKGEITAEQAIKECDNANQNYVKVRETADPVQTIGRAAEEFPWTFRSSRVQELGITNFVVDSMCKAGGTDIALELGTAVRGEFFEGDITQADIESVIRVDKRLYKVKVTGQQIWDIVEQGVETVNSSWFIMVSGLRYSYQPATDQEAGKLLTLEMADGSSVDMDKTYTVTASENQTLEFEGLFNFFGSPSEELPMNLREAVVQNIQELSEIKPILDGRITIKE